VLGVLATGAPPPPPPPQAHSSAGTKTKNNADLVKKDMADILVENRSISDLTRLSRTPRQTDRRPLHNTQRICSTVKFCGYIRLWQSRC
jgi:hypothetical protein